MRSTLLANIALLAGTAILTAGLAEASTIRSGMNGSVLSANDDGSTGLTSFGFTIDFFGVNYSGAYVNNNGNITFNGPQSTYTPFDIITTGVPMMAPFFGDVDTRGTGSGLVYYGTGTVGGRDSWGAIWDNVGYYGSHADRLNRFQLVIIDRSDTGAGNFDFEFNYDQIQWETGDASSGSGGLGGSSARAGWSNGSTATFELPGSAVNGAFLDGGPNALVDSTNIGEPGRWLFSARNSQVLEPPVANAGANIVYNASTLTQTLNGSASFDTDGSIISYQWTSPVGVVATTVTSALDIADSGLTDTTDTANIFLEVEDNDNLTGTDVTVASYTNVAPMLGSLIDAVQLSGGDANFSAFASDDDGVVNAFIAGFEELVLEVIYDDGLTEHVLDSTVIAGSGVEFGTGILGYADYSTLLSAFGGFGDFTLEFRVTDRAGLTDSDFLLFSFAERAVPVPGAALLLIAGIAALRRR